MIETAHPTYRRVVFPDGAIYEETVTVDGTRTVLTDTRDAATKLAVPVP